MSTPPGPRPETLALAAEAQHLIDTAGLSQVAIADRLHVNPKQVERALRAAREVKGTAQPRVRKPVEGRRRRMSRPSWGWTERAACKGMDPVLFFGREGERVRDRREKRAKAVCAGCPVRGECLDWSVSKPEHAGTWAGLNEDERRAERRRRQQRERLTEQRAAS